MREKEKRALIEETSTKIETGLIEKLEAVREQWNSDFVGKVQKDLDVILAEKIGEELGENVSETKLIKVSNVLSKEISEQLHFTPYGDKPNVSHLVGEISSDLKETSALNSAMECDEDFDTRYRSSCSGSLELSSVLYFAFVSVILLKIFLDFTGQTTGLEEKGNINRI